MSSIQKSHKTGKKKRKKTPKTIDVKSKSASKKESIKTPKTPNKNAENKLKRKKPKSPVKQKTKNIKKKKQMGAKTTGDKVKVDPVTIPTAGNKVNKSGDNVTKTQSSRSPKGKRSSKKKKPISPFYSPKADGTFIYA
eukprot:411502_1